jgi:hypothetical protein
VSSRWIIALAAVVVIGGGVLVYRATRGAGDTESPKIAAQPTPVDARPATKTTRPRPSLPSDLGGLQPEADTKPRVWTTGPTPEGEPMPLEDTAATMRRLGQARDAFKNEDWPRALAVAESVLTVMPGRESAREIAAMAACRLGDQDRAQDHADHLKRKRFKRTSNLCLDEDIRLLNPYASDPVDAGY